MPQKASRTMCRHGPVRRGGQHHGGDQCLERHDTPGGARCEGAKPGRLPDFWRIGQFRAMQQRTTASRFASRRGRFERDHNVWVPPPDYCAVPQLLL